jgi:hypothetical protein
LAVLTAFKYASKAVVIVLPNGVTIPQSLLDHELCLGKQPIFVSLGKFSQSEKDKLRTHYRVVDDSKRENSQDYYASLMRRFWI